MKKRYLLIYLRIQRCLTRHAQQQIPYIAFLGHHIYVRASVKPLHTHGHRRANPSTRISSRTTSSSDWLFCQSSTLSCYYSFTSSTKSKYVHKFFIWWHEWPCSFFSLSKSDEHQNCKGSRILSRVQGKFELPSA